MPSQGVFRVALGVTAVAENLRIAGKVGAAGYGKYSLTIEAPPYVD
jgi:hypothetical protein